MKRVSLLLIALTITELIYPQSNPYGFIEYVPYESPTRQYNYQGSSNYQSNPYGFVEYNPLVFFDITRRNLDQVVLEDGVYEVTMNCKSHTGLNNNYTLDIRIKNDRITHIYFDNNGYLHNGQNNSGYLWRGGGIQWDINRDGQITGGKAIIQIVYDYNGWQLFTLVI